MRKIKLLTMLIWVLGIISCNTELPAPIVSNFPFEEKWVFNTDNIYSMAAGDDWLLVSDTKGILALDIADGHVLWRKDYFPYGETGVLMINNIAYATDSSTVKAFTKSGRELLSFDLKKPNDSEAQIVTGSDKYILLLRAQSWNLEVYDLSTKELLWHQYAGRGGGEVFFNSSSANVYLVNANSVKAYDITNGALKWELPGNFYTSTYNGQFNLYLFNKQNTSLSDYLGTFESYDINNQKQVWSTTFSGRIHKMNIQGNLLLASTESGILAINSLNGEVVWSALSTEEFYSKPIMVNNIVFTKGALSKKIYALTENGVNIGYLQVERERENGQPYLDYVSGLYKSNETLIVTTDSKVLAYRP